MVSWNRASFCLWKRIVMSVGAARGDSRTAEKSSKKKKNGNVKD